MDWNTSGPKLAQWEPSEVIAPESYPPHVHGHCEDLSISKSIEERDSIVPAFTPGEAEGSFTRLWFYCKTFLFLRWLCVRQQEKLVWDLLAVADL